MFIINKTSKHREKRLTLAQLYSFTFAISLNHHRHSESIYEKKTKLNICLKHKYCHFFQSSRFFNSIFFSFFRNFLYKIYIFSEIYERNERNT